MTRAELLAATGNRWQVKCWQDGNCKRFMGSVYVRAIDAEQAKRIARQVKTGAKYCVAWPWDPRKDMTVSGFVQEVAL